MSELPSDVRLDRATDPEYAAVSVRAVLGLILSGLGVSAFILPWPLVAAPVAGALLSAWGLAEVRRSEGVLTGRRLAMAGMVLGAALALLASAWHVTRAVLDNRRLQDLSRRAYTVTDDVVADRWDKVYERLAPRYQQMWGGSPDALRDRLQSVFEGAGPMRSRTLRALRFIEDEERGVVIAPAEMRVELERRILRVVVVFEQSPEGEWHLAGIVAEPTFESFVKYGEPGAAPDQPFAPPPTPPPPGASK